MSLKLANPLHYPLAVLAGGVVLFAGVRLGRLPSTAILPAAAVVSILGAIALKSREPEPFELENPRLQRELQQARRQATELTQQAEALQHEARRLLTEIHEMELLGVVKYACDRAQELPAKIDQLSRRLSGKDSLLSIEDLQKQLQDVKAKERDSSGIAQEQWRKLAASVERNIALAQQGEDAREAQVVSLSGLIVDAAGVLQQLQNRLRSADLSTAAATEDLRRLSTEFSNMQENMDVLIAEGN